MLKDSSIKFAVVTRSDHKPDFDRILPENTQYLVDDYKDTLKFLQKALLRGLDVVFIDEAAFEDSQRGLQKDVANKALITFMQDVADAHKHVQVIYMANRRIKKRHLKQEFGLLYGAGITDIETSQGLMNRSLESIIEGAINRDSSQAQTSLGSEAKGGLLSRFGRNKNFKIPMGDVFNTEEKQEALEGKRALTDEMSDAARARKMLQDSGQFPKIQIDKESTVDDENTTVEEPADVEEENMEVEEVREPKVYKKPQKPTPISKEELGEPDKQSGEATIPALEDKPEIEEDTKAQIIEEQSEVAAGQDEIIPASMVAVMEHIREQFVREFAEREEAMRRDYEERLATLMRSGRAQRSLGVVSLTDAMTAEAAQELTLMAKRYFGKINVKFVEYDANKLKAVQTYGATSPDDKEVLSQDVVIHDWGTNIDEACKEEPDLLYVVLNPTPWNIESQSEKWAQVKDELLNKCGGVVVCVPASGPRMQTVSKTILGEDYTAIFAPNPNHYAEKAATASAFSESLEKILLPLAQEIDPTFKKGQAKNPNQRNNSQYHGNQNSQEKKA